MKFIFENVNIYIYIIYIIYKEAAVSCTKTMVVAVVIITDKKLMFSLHSQLASDEYLIP